MGETTTGGEGEGSAGAIERAGGEAWSESFEELAKRMRRRMSRILFRYRIPERDAEDVVQTTLMLLWKSRGKVEDPEAWLASTLRNRCLMYWRDRKAGYEPVVSSAAVSAVGETRDPEKKVGRGYPGVRVDLVRALRDLPARYRQVVVMQVIEGRSYAEVAAETGYKEGSIRKTRERAMEWLRRVLGVEKVRKGSGGEKRAKMAGGANGGLPGEAWWSAGAGSNEGGPEEVETQEPQGEAAVLEMTTETMAPSPGEDAPEERRPQRRQRRRRPLAVRLADLEAGLRRMEADVAETVVWLQGEDGLGERLERLREGQERLEEEISEAIAWLRTPRHKVARWRSDS